MEGYAEPTQRFQACAVPSALAITITSRVAPIWTFMLESWAGAFSNMSLGAKRPMAYNRGSRTKEGPKKRLPWPRRSLNRRPATGNCRRFRTRRNDEKVKDAL